MTQPNVTTIVDDTVATLDAEWDESNADKPVIGKSDDIGKGRDLNVYNYVELSRTSPTDISYSNLPLSAQDIDATVFVELKAASEADRDAIFDEFRRVIEANRSRPDTPGGFDRVVFADITPLDDSTFGAYLVEVTLAFEARSRSVEV